MSMRNSGFAWGIGSQQHVLAVLNDIAILFPIFLMIFTWRGFCQALVAKLMGDKTAEDDGFLTLNPLAHIDLYGFLTAMGVLFLIGGLFYSIIPRAVLFVILIMFGVRWTVPVTINDHNFHSYRIGGIVCSLSGALSNFVLAFMAGGLWRLSCALTLAPNISATIASIFTNLIEIAVFLGVLDLIPLPPFNGGKALRYALPQSVENAMDRLEEYSLFILLILFFAPVISNFFLGSIFYVSLFIKKLIFISFF